MSIMPPKKRAAQPYVPSPLLQTLVLEDQAAKRAATENSVDKVFDACDQLSASVISSSIPPRVSAPALRTLDIVVINADDGQNYRIVETPDWFPEDFNYLYYTRKGEFLIGEFDAADEQDWARLVRLFYGRTKEEPKKYNLLFGVKDMAQRKRILADNALCEEFFAKEDYDFDDFNLKDVAAEDMDKPTDGPTRKIIVRCE